MAIATGEATFAGAAAGFLAGAATFLGATAVFLAGAATFLGAAAGVLTGAATAQGRGRLSRSALRYIRVSKDLLC